MALTAEALRSGADEAWASEVRSLAADQDALIVAHNYQVPAIQDVADFVGDSLELSKIAAETNTPRSCSAESTSWPRRPRSWLPKNVC